MLAEHLYKCSSFSSRLIGLIGRTKLGPKEAYWLIPCNSVHTLVMNYAIDVYFLNKELKVVKILKGLKPNRFSGIYPYAYSTLEFVSGKRNCEIGDLLGVDVNDASHQDF